MSELRDVENVLESPDQWVRNFYEGLSRGIAGNEPAVDVIDRYHAEDVLQVSDGLELDRHRLIEHVAPLRNQGLREVVVDVHQALSAGDPDGWIIAARLTMHAHLSKREVVTQMHVFSRHAHDGRMRRAHIFTRPADPRAGQWWLTSMNGDRVRRPRRTDDPVTP